MEIGDTVRVIDYRTQEGEKGHLYDEYVGQIGEITDDLEDTRWELDYEVTFENDDRELFYEKELQEYSVPEGFEVVELDLPEALKERYGKLAEEVGLSFGIMVRYALVDYLIEDELEG